MRQHLHNQPGLPDRPFRRDRPWQERQSLQVGIVGGLSIGAKAFGDACCLLDGNPMQTLGEVALKDRVRISVRDPLSSREPGDVLLAQREIDCHQLIEGGKLAHVGFDQANRGHCASDCLLRLLLPLLFVLLRSFFWLPAHGEAHSAAKQLALVAFCLWPAGGRRAGRQTR